MTIVNYLGCNFHLPFGEDNSDNFILVSGIDVRIGQQVKKHLSTNYVYEVYTRELVGFYVNDFHKEKPEKLGFRERQNDFQALIEFLDSHLAEGDYCELYTCWSGDEEEERDKEYDQTIIINQFDINDIEIYEKTLLVIKK